MKSRMIMVVSLLVMLTMACNLTQNIAGNAPTQGPTGGEATAPGPGPTKVENTAPSPEPTKVEKAAPNPVPVAINDGLNSLNSYAMTVIFHSVGPNPAKSSTITIQRQRSNDTNASLTSIHSTATSADGGDPAPSDSTIYQIGNDQCSGSDKDGWSWTSTTPAEAEMQGLITGMIGLTPLIHKPVFVAAETVNGIPTNHFTFKVPGLGATSGAVVNINQGDYWLAVDGQYIVKYILIVETSMSAGSEVLHEEISIEMNQINQPVSIAFPKGCLAASKATPVP
jgi:hypothetical protein